MANIYANLLAQKKNVCIRKELNSHRTGLGHQHGRRDVLEEFSFLKLLISKVEIEA